MEAEELWSPGDDADLRAFAAAARGGDLAGALLAVDGVDAEAAAADRRVLETLARRVCRRTVERNPGVQAWAMAGVLGDEAGFRGDPEHYYAPEHGHLHEVLARHRGLPILLAAVWIEVGRRAHVDVQGIALPGHFVARVGGDAGILVDPFEGGRPLTPADCHRLAIEHGQFEWHPEYLEAAPADALLERVLHNLVHIHDRAGDVKGLYRDVRFLAALRPGEPGYLLDRGNIGEALGARAIASAAYRELAARFPGSREARLAEHRLRDLAGKRAMPN